MNQRTTQALLAVAGVLLLAQLFRPPVPAAAADEAGQIPAVLRARRFELVDERGQVRMNLKVEPDGEVVFRLRDATGAIRVKVGASADGSGIVLLNDQSEPGAQLLARSAGTTVTLTEKGKEKRVIQP